jgi:hypothetical protein
MAAVQPEPWVRALITINSAFTTIHAISQDINVYYNMVQGGTVWYTSQYTVTLCRP